MQCEDVNVECGSSVSETGITDRASSKWPEHRAKSQPSRRGAHKPNPTRPARLSLWPTPPLPHAPPAGSRVPRAARAACPSRKQQASACADAPCHRNRAAHPSRQLQSSTPANRLPPTDSLQQTPADKTPARDQTPATRPNPGEYIHMYSAASPLNFNGEGGISARSPVGAAPHGCIP